MYQCFLGANHLSFEAGEGYRWFGPGKNFSPKPLVIEYFFLINNGVRLFSQHYRSWKVFFQRKNFFRQVFPGKNLFLSKWVCRIFLFLKLPIPPQKSNGQPQREEGVSKEICGTVRLPVWRHVSRQWLSKWRANFIEDTDKNFDLITEILIRFLGFGDFKVPIVIEN